MKKETINVYLDDRRTCPEGYVLARNVDEAILLFEKYNVHLLSLDHDLGKDENGELLPSGYDFVKCFRDRRFRADKIYIHTDNGPGRSDMFESLKSYRRHGFIDEDIEIYHYSITVDRYMEEESE